MISRRKFVSYPALALASQTGGAAAPPGILEQVRSGARLEGVDIVDCHTHFQKSRPGLFWPRDVEMLMADAERCGISQVIASHVSGYMATNEDQMKTAHDECVEAAAKYPQRLRIYLTFVPRLLKTSVAEMRRVRAALTRG